MPELPEHPDLDQLRRLARELHRAAQAADPDAVRRLRAVSEDVSLAAAQLTIARDHGFSGWPAFKSAVREITTPPARAPSEEPLGDRVKCSFCGKSGRQVMKLIAGPGVYICNECVGLCQEILEMEDDATAKGGQGDTRPTSGTVDRSSAPEIVERDNGVDVRLRLAERSGPWTREYPALARMLGLDAAIEEEPEHALHLRVRLHGAFREPEIFDALDRALLLVGDAKDQARHHEALADTTRRHVNRWWQEKIVSSSAARTRP